MRSLFVFRYMRWPTILVMLALLSSCGTTRYAEDVHPSSKDAYFAQTRKGLIPDLGRNTRDRVVQYSADVTVRVNEADSINQWLVAVSERYEGYVVRLSDTRSTIRVKQQHLERAVGEVSEQGRVRSKAFSGLDVTEQYVDLTARLANAHHARDRYLELLAQAENVTAALAVEKELERVNGDIESMEGKLNKLTHLSDMATIVVRIEEREKLGPLGYIVVGAWKGVRWLFVRV